MGGQNTGLWVISGPKIDLIQPSNCCWEPEEGWICPALLHSAAAGAASGCTACRILHAVQVGGFDSYLAHCIKPHLMQAWLLAAMMSRLCSANRKLGGRGYGWRVYWV